MEVMVVKVIVGGIDVRQRAQLLWVWSICNEIKMAEHRALLKCTDCITNLLQHQVLSISSKLLAKGLTTKEVHSWVLTSMGVSNEEKAARLVSCVTDHVKSSPEKYPVFVDILKDEPFFKEAVKNLSSEYHSMSILKISFASYQSRAPPTPSPPPLCGRMTGNSQKKCAPNDRISPTSLT